MTIQNLRINSKAGWAVLLWVTMQTYQMVAAGTWVPLVNQAPQDPGGIGGMMLLSDGSVLCFNNGAATNNSAIHNLIAGTNCYRLAPDQHGSYINGTWTTMAPRNYSRSAFAADVVPDGRVFVAGGEYGFGITNAEIYDPVANTWSVVDPPISLFNPNAYSDGTSFPQVFSDMISVVISNGTVLMAPINPRNYGGTLIYNPKSNVWSDGPLLTNNAYDQWECSWARLADGSILTIDQPDSTKQGTNYTGRLSERYIPSLNQWVPDAIVPVYLWNTIEIGPVVTLPNEQAFFIGSDGANALYTPSGNSSPGVWSAAALSPTNLDGAGNLTNLEAADLPAVMMVNGKVLCALGATCGNGGCPSPYYFYEYDYSAGPGGSFMQVNTPFGSVTFTLPSCMLDLPDGTVLFSDFSNQLYVYQPDGSPVAAGRPTITSIAANPDGSFHLAGTGLNGISEGGTFGDEFQNNENYPLVRMTNNVTGGVYYARTYNWSSTDIQTGSTPVTTEFTLPASVFAGGGTNYSLVVVANGIASDPVTFYGPIWVDFHYTGTLQLGTFSYPYSTLAQGIGAVPSGGTIFVKPGSSTETPTITKPMTIIAIGGAATVGQ